MTGLKFEQKLKSLSQEEIWQEYCGFLDLTMEEYMQIQNRLMEEMSGPAVQKTGTLYLRLPSEEGTLFQKIRAILGMFPGESQVVVYFADTKQRRGTRCVLMDSMLEELQNVLGDGNVVMK